MPNKHPNADLSIVHAYIAVCASIESLTAQRCAAVASYAGNLHSQGAVNAGYGIVMYTLRSQRKTLRSLIDFDNLWPLYYREAEKTASPSCLERQNS